MAAKRLLTEITTRLDFNASRFGLLTLNRQSNTLSVAKINYQFSKITGEFSSWLALRSGEPSIGLHGRDTIQLIAF